jgi:hypothetical protein
MDPNEALERLVRETFNTRMKAAAGEVCVEVHPERGPGDRTLLVTICMTHGAAMRFTQTQLQSIQRAQLEPFLRETAEELVEKFQLGLLKTARDLSKP